MARIRLVEIKNFRSIKSLTWYPSNGINCLIGLGDSGKSTILDAIDWVLVARRGLLVSDADFFGLDVSQPIEISLTIGDLPERLKHLDYYGECLRGYCSMMGEVQDEPAKGLETVLTVRLTIAADLEPIWSLYSDRNAHLAPPKSLQWKDRTELAPARLGQHPNSNLSWTRGSVLNRLTEERADIGLALVNAARDARAAFGATAAPQLEKTLGMVTATAKSLGVNIGASATALLDAHAASSSDGAISLHSEAGVPLRSLGTGSTRLLIAGLHRAAAVSASILLVDEVEHGLEPHRIHRLLDSFGAKDKGEPLQLFMTTHSPVVLRELSANQLHIVRGTPEKHHARFVLTTDAIQATLRSHPEAFLARTVIICEGASEVGLVRGLDQYWTECGHPSLQAGGVAYVDVGGGDPDRAFQRAAVFQALGYRVAVLQDNDKAPTAAAVQKFTADGGCLLAWRHGRALEDELFASLPTVAITSLLNQAEELTPDGTVNNHLVTKSNGLVTLEKVRAEGFFGEYSAQTRQLLGEASRIRKAGWFKSITRMAAVAHDVVGPNLDASDQEFSRGIYRLIHWAHGNA